MLLNTQTRAGELISPRGNWNSSYLALSWALACSLLLAGGCSRTEPFDPPDPFYFFASYPVGKNPTTLATADFNADGFTDIVTTNISSNTLSFLFGNGDGTFREQVQVRVCQEPRSLVTSDFNLDGLPDIALACSGSDQVSVLLGKGHSKFEEASHYPVYRTPVSIASQDVNGDDKPDLVVALRNDKIKVFLGTGTGEFRPGLQYEYGDTPTSIALQDLDNDGKADLIVTNGGPMSSAVSIWISNGDGSFRSPVDYKTGKRPLGVSFGDFNNDRILDLLVINGERDSFTTFLGNGNATFQSGKDSGADAGPNFGLVRDFNGDRLSDVAIVNLQSNDLSILFGRGDGTFQYPPRNYRTPSGPFAVAIFRVSIQEAEEPGLAVANNGAGSVSIFLHRGRRGTTIPSGPG